MKQIRINRQHRPAREWLEPLPPDARDPDVVRAKQLARRADSRSQRQRRSGHG
jgi:hypothetical protein